MLIFKAETANIANGEGIWIIVWCTRCRDVDEGSADSLLSMDGK